MSHHTLEQESRIVSHTRTVRSFVCREKKLTPLAQAQWDILWGHYGLTKPHSSAHSFFDFEATFGRSAPCILEIGFGEGHSLIHSVKTNPQIDFIGIEVYQTGLLRVMKALNTSHSTNKNLKLFCGDAIDFLISQIPDNSLTGIQLFFPDPWPKRRHHKRRLLNPAFLEQVSRVLVPKGLLYFVTDWKDYANHAVALFKNNLLLSNALSSNLLSSNSLSFNPFSLLSIEHITNSAFETHQRFPNLPMRTKTKYERRAEKLGATITEIIIQKQGR